MTSLSQDISNLISEKGPDWAKMNFLPLDNNLFKQNSTSIGSLHLSNLSFEDKKNLLISIREFCALTPKPPMQSRLPFSYQALPPFLRIILANLIGKSQRKKQSSWAKYPRFPIDLTADALEDSLFSTQKNLETTPVLLSHDIDSPEGLKNLIELFVPIEKDFRACSSNFIVPKAWKISTQYLDTLKNNGFEIGVHGFDHSNTTAFLNEQEMRDRLNQCNDFISQWGVTGYRSPSLLRTKLLLKNLSKIYKYDSSIPTSGGLFPTPNNGCASARPFKIEGIFEIPLSLPRDGSLRFLGYSPNDILKLWLDCANTIHQSGGVVVLLTHCEKRFSGNKKMLGIYKKFLEEIYKDPRFTFMTHNEYYLQNESHLPEHRNSK